MKLYRYWKRERSSFTAPDGSRREISALGRSNSSERDAASDARARLRRVEDKVCGREVPEKEDYAADIREEIVREPERGSVVTRNRYGALVLNTETVTIVDVDEPRLGLLAALGFGRRPKKEMIVSAVEKEAARGKYSGLGFRIYETHKGVRVIVTGEYCDPLGRGLELMRAMNADPLFAVLCGRQGCYRARLTPKPHRIRMKGIRYRWPLDEAEAGKAKGWIAEYESRSRGFAVCRYLKTVGRQDMPGSIVQLHDADTRAGSGLPLA